MKKSIQKKSLLQKFAGIFEKKSADYQRGSLDQLLLPYTLGISRGIGWLSALGAINYYTSISPIANAVDLIAEVGARIFIAVYDKSTKEYIKDTTGISTPAKALNLLQTTRKHILSL